MPDTILSDFRLIQNTAARILTKCGDRTILVLICLKIYIGYQIDSESPIFFIILTFKAYHKIAPPYIRVLLFLENIIGQLDQIIPLH